jgi:GH18 family chitinase
MAFSQQRKVGWSFGYYCCWNQPNFPPTSIKWNAFTHIGHFTIFPHKDGTLDSNVNAPHTMGGQHSFDAVAAAHAAGVRIVLCVGGAGVRDTFTSATSPANIHKFVSNILRFMRTYGYDGIDTDWEENFNASGFLAWHKELKDSINAINALGGPRKSLTIAGGGYFARDCAPAAPYVEQMNDMSYDVPLSNIPGRIAQFTNLGVPKSLLGVGIGIGTGGGMVDGNVAAWTGKANYAVDNGLGGIMEWAVTGGSLQVACFNALAPYVVHLPTPVLSGKMIAMEPEGTLIIRSNGVNGPQEICYTLSTGANVDLGVYDVKGALVRTLARGQTNAGVFSVPFAKVSAGAYVVKLSTDSKVQAAKTLVIK